MQQNNGVRASAFNNLIKKTTLILNAAAHLIEASQSSPYLFFHQPHPLASHLPTHPIQGVIPHEKLT